MALWSRIGCASGTTQVLTISACGRCRCWVGNRRSTCKVWPNLIGQATDLNSLITHLGPEILYLYRTAHAVSTDRPIFTAPAGLHSHFPLWSPDSKFIYFVQGTLPDKLDIWRIPAVGGTPERITSQNALVSHPVLLDHRTLMYLACDPDGSGPWPYSIDVERRIPHRLDAGPERFTSLAVSADGRRLVATVASPKKTLWRLRLADSHADGFGGNPILLTTGTGFSPRLGPDFLLYVSAAGTGESIWKLAKGTSTELWSGEATRVFGGPAISADGRSDCVFGSTAWANSLVRDAGRRHERADCCRFARPSRSPSVVARRQVNYISGH